MGLRELLWDCAKASHPKKFKDIIEALRKKSLGVVNWLQDKPAYQWSRSHFSSYPKCDVLTNNLCESFNNMIKRAREKLILSMLEDIRDLLMKRLNIKRTMCQKWFGDLCPNALQRLERAKKYARDCIATPTNDHLFQVRTIYGDQYTVDIQVKGCSCKKWI